MTDPLAELVHDLERRYAMARRPDCLDETTLAGLADGSLPHAQTRPALDHLRDCSVCLHAYAVIRRLSEVPELEAVGARSHSEAARGTSDQARGWRYVWAHIRAWVAVPVPLGWSGALVAATLLLTWSLPQVLHDTTQSERGVQSEWTKSFRSTVVTGVVEEIAPVSGPDPAGYILVLRDANGQVYRVFFWGSPAVTIGAQVRVEGRFEERKGKSAVVRGIGERLSGLP